MRLSLQELMYIWIRNCRQKFLRAAGERCCICIGQTLRVHLADGSTFLRESIAPIKDEQEEEEEEQQQQQDE